MCDAQIEQVVISACSAITCGRMIWFRSRGVLRRDKNIRAGGIRGREYARSFALTELSFF
jgi:hypothetical protein